MTEGSDWTEKEVIPQVKGMPRCRVWPGLMGVLARDMRLDLGGVMGQ